MAAHTAVVGIGVQVGLAAVGGVMVTISEAGVAGNLARTADTRGHTIGRRANIAAGPTVRGIGLRVHASPVAKSLPRGTGLAATIHTCLPGGAANIIAAGARGTTRRVTHTRSILTPLTLFTGITTASTVSRIVLHIGTVPITEHLPTSTAALPVATGLSTRTGLPAGTAVAGITLRIDAGAAAVRGTTWTTNPAAAG